MDYARYRSVNGVPFSGGGAAPAIPITTAACPTITVSPTVVPDGTINVDYASVQFTQTGGTAPVTWSLTAGALPSGMTLSAAGLLAGVPTASGPFSFTVTATDTNSCTGSVPLSLMTGPNQPPSFTPGANQTVLEDAGPQSAPWATAISPGPPHEAGQIVTFEVAVGNPSLFSTLPAVSADGTLTYTPAANANGSAMVTVTLRDNGGTANGGDDSSDPAAFTITVQPVNDAPVITDGDAAANAVAENSPNGTPVGIRASAIDPELDSVAFSLFENAGGRFQIDPVTGVVSVANGALLDFELATSHGITVVATDGSLQTSAAFTIAVTDVPPGPCVCTPSTFTNTTPVAIPTGPGVVTSTLTVTGAGPVLADVNLTTFIPHTFAADLDITITSPAGTVVTLTTDNGAGNDNVFNGTVWDDDANPAGQVPYTTNNGLVTDHAYVNLTVASPLAPEDALAAFNGEDPNGTWTVTISDDLAGDGGSLDSWSLNLCTLQTAPTATTTSFTNNTPTAIPTGPAVVTSTLNVAGVGAQIGRVTLLTNLTHTFAADLDITITSPAGTVVTLTTDNGAGNDNVFNGTLWDDDANPAGQVPYTTNNGLATDNAYVNLTPASSLVPEEALAAFIGEDPNGTWTITISDDLAGDGGSLDSWTLNITTTTCESAVTLAQGTDVGEAGASDSAAVESLTSAGFRLSSGGVGTSTGEAADAELEAYAVMVRAGDRGEAARRSSVQDTKLFETILGIQASVVPWRPTARNSDRSGVAGVPASPGLLAITALTPRSRRGVQGPPAPSERACPGRRGGIVAESLIVSLGRSSPSVQKCVPRGVGSSDARTAA